MQLIEAGRDYETLERYLSQFVEYAATLAESALVARRRELRRAAAVNPERLEAMSQSLLPAIPRAFEMWILHLSELDSLSSAVAFTLDDLTVEESRGLAMLRCARHKFWESHASCPHCGTVNPRHASFCGGCGEQEVSGSRFQPDT